MSSTSPRVAYVTAGAAGMYCGSCMHDNTLARGLSRHGIDVQLVPTYTPIRTDEENVSVDRVFYGGISVYLEQKSRWYRRLSPLLSPLVDQTWFIRWATRRAASTDPRVLGALTVSMLQGTEGYQRREAEKLCQWLSTSARPHLVLFSNILIGGCIPTLKSRLGVPLLVTLQGDDVFLEQLPSPFREQALGQIRGLVTHVDGFLVHSQFYADFMADYFQIPPDKIHQVPLGIDITGYPATPHRQRATPQRNIGYLARLAPEKGFHLLVDAFLQLHREKDLADVRLKVAGWLGEHQRSYVEAQVRKLREAGCEDAYSYVGSVNRTDKIDFLQTIDVLTVPTVQLEPKGLFVLEALAAGVPVVQPSHGAFPELLGDLGGGRLVPPHDVTALSDALATLLRTPADRAALAEVGHGAVHSRYHSEAAARTTWETLEKFL